MGTWGTGVFDDDTVADWSGDLQEAPGWQQAWRVRAALVRAATAPGYLDRDVGGVALAAAAVVAAARPGGPVLEGPYAPGPEALVGLGAGALDRVLARRAVRRVLGPRSEWRDLWAEAGDLEAAEAALRPVVAALARR